MALARLEIRINNCSQSSDTCGGDVSAMLVAGVSADFKPPGMWRGVVFPPGNEVSLAFCR
jgi:hypothetical protein